MTILPRRSATDRLYLRVLSKNTQLTRLVGGRRSEPSQPSRVEAAAARDFNGVKSIEQSLNGYCQSFPRRYYTLAKDSTGLYL
uniref:Uncharacterized protein n=1 Tax=Trichogramma kaykai TaxID=54128 RepID=A0ABD2WR50_9HYME